MRASLLAAGQPPERVDRLQLPVATWILARAAEQPAPLLVGVNGPQGAGKSTLVDALVTGLGAVGRRVVALSVDDVYLPHTEQRALAAAWPGNPTLEHRGYPGTHDVALGTRVLDALRAGEVVTLPVYDKGAHGGRGDRRPEGRAVDGPWDVILFEGWMLGFRPVAAVPPPLAPANEMLAAYAAWVDRLDVSVLLTVADDRQVVAWRVDAERARRARGEPALSEAEVRDYVERFLPAYAAWGPGLRAHPPGRTALTLRLGPDRLPVDPSEPGGG